MEVEAACDSVDVEAFAGNMETGDSLALHGFEIDFFEADAATGDELVFADDTALNANRSR